MHKHRIPRLFTFAATLALSVSAFSATPTAVASPQNWLDSLSPNCETAPPLKAILDAMLDVQSTPGKAKSRTATLL